MKLVYKNTQQPVNLGDVVILKSGEAATVDYFAQPHKPSSEGKVSILPGGEFYVSVIGAEWIDREDRAGR